MGDIDLNRLLSFHCQQKTLATLTAVQPPGRFGAFPLEEGQPKIYHFREKQGGDGAWINGGFFAWESAMIDYIKGDSMVWE